MSKTKIIAPDYYARELIQDLSTKYKVSLGGIQQRVTRALYEDADVAEKILEANVLSFGDNRENEKEFKNYVKKWVKEHCHRQ